MTMAKRNFNNIQLGIFALVGLLFLVVMLYMIGKNKNMFGHTFQLKARFDNVHGLVSGNNVRFAGIEAGTVEKIEILNDTTIEVQMYIDEKFKSFLHNNAVASIATDGLMGNKVINISPVNQAAPLVKEGDLIATSKAVDIDQMLRTLSATNEDVAVIARNLKVTVDRLNNSSGLWKLLNDERIPADIRSSAANIKLTTSRSASLIADLQQMVNETKSGKGVLGVLLQDTGFSRQLDAAMTKIQAAANNIDTLSNSLKMSASHIQSAVVNPKTTAGAILDDSLIVQKIHASLENIRLGTEGFNQNMEALKHNFLFRSYFRKLEREQAKQKKITNRESDWSLSIKGYCLYLAPNSWIQSHILRLVPAWERLFLNGVSARKPWYGARWPRVYRISIL